MTTTLWRLKVQPENEPEFERLVTQLVRDVHANEPGQVFEYRRTRGDVRIYVLFYSFNDEAAFARYSAAPYHRSVSPEIMACLSAPPVAEELESF